MPTERSIKKWLARAIDLHQRDRTEDARSLYEKILNLQPDNSDALHLLGLINAKDGKTDLALARLNRAHSLDPKNAELLSNLGGIYRKLGRRDDAIACFKAGLAVVPRHPVLHNNLGVTYQDAGRHDAAISSFRAALAGDRRYAEAHNNLGSSLVLLGRPEQAIPHFIHAISLAGRYPKAVRNLESALAACELRVAPGRPDTIADASKLFAKAYDVVGQSHYAQNAHAAALAAFDKSLAHFPDDVNVVTRRVGCLIALERSADVVQVVEGLVASNPSNAKFHAVLGQARAQLGEATKAVADLRRAIALDPDNAEAYALLARAHSLAEDEAFVAEMASAYGRTQPDSTQRMLMAFSLAKAKEDQSDFVRAFAYLKEANLIRGKGRQFDVREALRRLAILRDVFAPELMQRNVPAALTRDKPIFIVGMPRSGTTLVESILGAHHAVLPCGEMQVMSEQAMRLGLCERGQPPLFRPLSPDTRFDALARAYLDGVSAIRPEVEANAHFADKMPDNFWNIGLIRLAFPGATIVHCRRAAADTCLSIYKTDFNSDWHRYAHDLSHLGAYYAIYRATMKHWDDVLPQGSIKTIDYEDLVADPETGTRRLIEMCDLDWDDNCLSFHAARRVVHTASVFQVRRPVYGSSVGLASAYGEDLKPLFDALERPITATPKRHFGT